MKEVVAQPTPNAEPSALVQSVLLAALPATPPPQEPSGLLTVTHEGLSAPPLDGNTTPSLSDLVGYLAGIAGGEGVDPATVVQGNEQDPATPPTPPSRRVATKSSTPPPLPSEARTPPSRVPTSNSTPNTPPHKPKQVTSWSAHPMSKPAQHIQAKQADKKASKPKRSARIQQLHQQQQQTDRGADAGQPKEHGDPTPAEAQQRSADRARTGDFRKADQQALSNKRKEVKKAVRKWSPLTLMPQPALPHKSRGQYNTAPPNKPSHRTPLPLCQNLTGKSLSSDFKEAADADEGGHAEELDKLTQQVNEAAKVASWEVGLLEHHQSVEKAAAKKKADRAAAANLSQSTKDALIANMTVPANLQEGGTPNKKAKTTINQFFDVAETTEQATPQTPYE